jgi:hypothetical protein
LFKKKTESEQTSEDFKDKGKVFKLRMIDDKEEPIKDHETGQIKFFHIEHGGLSEIICARREKYFPPRGANVAVTIEEVKYWGGARIKWVKSWKDIDPSVYAVHMPEIVQYQPREAGYTADGKEHEAPSSKTGTE